MRTKQPRRRKSIDSKCARCNVLFGLLQQIREVSAGEGIRIRHRYSGEVPKLLLGVDQRAILLAFDDINQLCRDADVDSAALKKGGSTS